MRRCAKRDAGFMPLGKGSSTSDTANGLECPVGSSNVVDNESVGVDSGNKLDAARGLVKFNNRIN